MRIAPLAALVAAALSATGLAALTVGRGVSHFPATPARAHQAIGPVTVLARPGADEPAMPLAEAARDRYGRIDALAQVRAMPLPWSDAALISGIALRWD